MTGRRAWSLLTIEGTRQYGGNTGYEDNPSSIYRYDSNVANHRQVGRGDVVIVRTGTAVLGVAEIEQIVEGVGRKDRLRCPECGATNIKRRATKLPAFGCRNRHFFDNPVNEPVEVTKFEAHYGTTFRPCDPSLTVARLHEAVLRPSDQMSIKEIDLARIESLVVRDGASAELIRRFARSLTLPEDDGNGDDGGDQSIIEQHRRVLREIKLRQGQARFRNRLIRRYGAQCQVSRCAFPGLVEAAHVRPYAKTSDNSATNGLLLRSDLHTLFDLGLLGIDPASMKIALAPATLAAGYQQFVGMALFTNETPGPDKGALAERWEFFQTKLGVG